VVALRVAVGRGCSHAWDEPAVLEYAIRNQPDRRNLTPEALGRYVARALQVLDQRKARGGDQRSAAVRSKASADAVTGQVAPLTTAGPMAHSI
jgi:hypothetical protein